MNELEVYYKNVRVGKLACNNNICYFQYDKNWLKEGFSISPLSLPLKDIVFQAQSDIFDGLFGVFADSLPDSWGRLLLKRYIKKNYPDQNIDTFFMLSCIGNNGMGALEYRPILDTFDFKYDINYDEIQKEVDLALDDKDFNVDLLYKQGGSSGGARPKILININNESWIIKFHSKFDIKDSGLMEYKYALCCQEIGIDMMEVKLIPSKLNSGYFATKRFDRNDNNKIHMISFSAILETDSLTSSLDYSDLFKLVKKITNDNKDDINQLFLRMCFNVYAHNYDDHLKNFSFIYDERIGCYRLSPAYDMTYSETSFNEHTITINNKGKDITKSDLLLVGTKAGIAKEECIRMISKTYNVVSKRLKEYL